VRLSHAPLVLTKITHSKSIEKAGACV
jgi:hypothetical protein